MNRILNNKINSNITQIIGSYLLPSIRKLNILKTQNFSNLRNETYSILCSLRLNRCFNNFYNVSYDNFSNSKIIKDPKYNYWTIRNLS